MVFLYTEESKLLYELNIPKGDPNSFIGRLNTLDNIRKNCMSCIVE